MSKEENSKEVPFEQSFSRLEEILEKMNSGAISLDESLKLYEEADKLIRSCHTRLSHAEQRVEVLVKERQDQLSLDQNQEPVTQSFHQE